MCISFRDHIAFVSLTSVAFRALAMVILTVGMVLQVSGPRIYANVIDKRYDGIHTHESS